MLKVKKIWRENEAVMKSISMMTDLFFLVSETVVRIGIFQITWPMDARIGLHKKVFNFPRKHVTPVISLCNLTLYDKYENGIFGLNYI